jgi:hypothetical protein
MATGSSVRDPVCTHLHPIVFGSLTAVLIRSLLWALADPDHDGRGADQGNVHHAGTPCLVFSDLIMARSLFFVSFRERLSACLLGEQFKNFTDRPSCFRPNRHINHLLWARGPHWRFVRNAISPAFAPRSLQQFCGQMNTSAARLVGACVCVSAVTRWTSLPCGSLCSQLTRCQRKSRATSIWATTLGCKSASARRPWRCDCAWARADVCRCA